MKIRPLTIRALRSVVGSTAYLKAFEYYSSREVSFALEVASLRDIPTGWRANGTLSRYDGSSELWFVDVALSLNGEEAIINDWCFGVPFDCF